MSTDTRSVKQLTEEMLAKHGEWKNILDKGDELTPEDLEKCQSLKGEFVELQGRVQAFDVVEGYRSDYKSAEDFLVKPVNRMAHAPASPESKGEADDKGRFEVLGVQAAGHTEVEYSGTRVRIADEVGAGSLGVKAWKAINTTEYREAFASYLRKGKANMEAAERKTLEEGFDDQGGYTVPIEVILNNIVQRKPTPTRIAALCANLNTGREYLELIKLNYAGDNIYSTGFRVTKTGENPGSATAAQVNDTNLFGTIKIPVHTFMIRGLVTRNMIEDSAIGIMSWLGEKFGETVDILKDDKVINGTNRQEPMGFMNSYAGSAAGSGLDDPKISVINSGDASTVTPDGLMNLALDVPEQYEDACRFVFNKTSTFKAIRTLKDLNDRYLFGMGTADSGLATPTRPTDLLGYPYSFSGLMPSIAANAYPIVFGDLMGVQVVNRIGFSIQVLNEVYAETNAVALVGRVRFGSQVTQPWRLRIQKISA